jgi:ADP-heptose:LPS heptosyltransferase
VGRCTHSRNIGVVDFRYRFLLGGFYHFAHGDDSSATASAEPMFREFCRQFGVPPVESHAPLVVGGAVLARVKSLLAERGVAGENMVLLHTGPSWPVKEGPAAHWTALAGELCRSGFANLVRIGTNRYMKSQQTQVPHSLNVAVDLGVAEIASIPNAVSLVGALSLEETIAMISLARLFVGIDSGLLHAAACLRTPAVGIFGPTLPRMFYNAGFHENFAASNVECAGCHHRVPRLHWITGCPYDIKCMKQISPGEVLRHCLAAMAPNPPDA